MSTTTANPWRSALLWALAVIVAVGAGGWLAVSCGPDRAAAERPVTDEEAQMLSQMRLRNHQSEPVAVRLLLPVEGGQAVVDGYIDWQGPLLYARTPAADGGRRLAQAVPGLVATRPDDAAFEQVAVPREDWTTRRMLAGGATPNETVFDIVVSSLFTLTSRQGDDPGYLAEHATWREEGLVDGETVDVFRAPILVESNGAAAASPEALYSVDRRGDLRRFQVNTGGAELATVEFLRAVEFDASRLEAIDLLGGPASEPTEVGADLAATLAGVRHENWAAAAAVELRVPVGDRQVASGHGYVDWRTMTAYLNVRDGGDRHLLLAGPGGLARLPVDSDELPEPLPVDGWETHELTEAEASDRFGPVETMVYRLLEMASEEPEDAEELAEGAWLLRVDEHGGEPTYVVEFPVAGDTAAAAGESTFRYHVSGGRLTEVEMVTYWGVAGAALTRGDYAMAPVPWGLGDAIG